eukprot:g58171.t1
MNPLSVFSDINFRTTITFVPGEVLQGRCDQLQVCRTRRTGEIFKRWAEKKRHCAVRKGEPVRSWFCLLI